MSSNHRAKHDLFLDGTRTRVVPGEHADAKFLLARAGQEIPAATAEKHGLVEGGLPDAMPDLSTPRNNVAPEGDGVRRGPGRPPKSP